jgi:hypothetical protein
MNDEEQGKAEGPKGLSDNIGFASRSLRSFSDMHADVWSVVRQYPVVFLLVPIVVWFPFDALAEGVAQAAGDDSWSYFRSYYRVNRITQFFVGGWMAALILTGTRLVADGSIVSLRNVLLQGSKQYGRVLGVMFSFGWRVAIATILLVIPGVILALGYAVSLPIAVFEKHSGRDALEVSEEYMKGGKRKLLVYVLLAALLYLPGAFGIQFLLPEVESPLFAAVLHIPTNFLGVLFTIALVMVYADATGNPAFARPIGPPVPQESYIAQARGRIAPRSLVRIVLAVSLVLFAAGSYKLMMEPDLGYNTATFGAYDDELYYDGNIDEATVQKLGEALLELGYFGNEQPISVALVGEEDFYILYFFIEREWSTDPDVVQAFQNLEAYLSKHVMDKPVSISLKIPEGTDGDAMPVQSGVD